jgi:hypothetical protein
MDLMEESRRRVVPVLPECGLAYVEVVAQAADPTAPEAWRRESALRVARGAWDGSERMRGEGGDPACALCFSRLGEDPFDREFERISVELFLPLLRSVEEPKPKRSSKGVRKATSGGGAP